MGTILFYSSVNNIDDFKYSLFYRIDVEILKSLGYEVIVTNKIVRFIRYRSYDIGFLYFYRKSLIPAFFARLARKRIYFTGGIDALSLCASSRWQRIIQRLLFIGCYFASTKCIIVSKSDLENIKRFWKNDKKLILVPHAVEVSRYNPNRKKLDIITSICWMGSVENVKRKGVDKLINGMKGFLSEYPLFNLYIIGRIGPGTEYLKKLTDRLGLNDKVVFLGSMEENNKIGLLEISKYYAQLSEYEGFGLSVIEAMAAGCIVVHSGRGGLEETIADAGVLVRDIDDDYCVSQAFIECQRNAELAESKIAIGLERVKKLFDYRVRYSALERILAGQELAQDKYRMHYE